MLTRGAPVRHLAQLYRLGDFEQARDLFDDLASIAEQVRLPL